MVPMLTLLRRALLAACVVAAISGNCLEAQNLAPNSSFEGGGWPQANTGSADYLTASNVFGYQLPRSGTYMMGETFGDQAASTFREYIKAPLTSPLVVGQAYFVEMYVSLCENYGSYGTNNHAFAFTTTNPSYGYSYGPIPLVPQVRNLTPITSQTAWTQVSGTFTASQAFTYVTIGNFNNDATTTYVYVAPGTYTYGYYYMDDINVQPAVVLGACCTRFSAEPLEQQKVALDWAVSPNTEGKIFEVQRSLDGETFTTLEAIRLEPQNLVTGFQYVDATAPFNCTLHYRILQNDGNANIHYSEVQTVQLDHEAIGQFQKVFPSILHSDQPFQVSYQQRSAQGQVHLRIHDMLGREVFAESYQTIGGENVTWVQPPSLDPGTYVVSVSGDGGKGSQKIQVIQ
jgi:hypothetical protein